MASWNPLGNFGFQKAAQIEAQLEEHIAAPAEGKHRPNWFHKKYA